MTTLARKTQTLFASGASDIGQFGSGAAGTKVLTTDPAVIQALPAWAAGWLNATLGANKFPPIEEVNALDYLETYQLTYLFQEGIPEYDSGTVYSQYGICKKSGTFQIYGSLTASNTGNALSDGTHWKLLVDLNSSLGFNLSGGLSLAVNTTLTVVNMGSLINLGADGLTITLPALSAISDGDSVLFTSVSTAAQGGTISAAGSDTIVDLQANSTVSSVYLSGGQFMIITYVSAIGAWVANATSPCFSGAAQGSFKNLSLAWASNSTATISADQICLENTAGTTHKVRATSLTLNTGASGANGLDTGSLASSTWYYVFVIYNPSTRTQACLMSASSISPTMPSGYFYKARVGAFRTDGSGHIIGFSQKGRRAQYLVGSNCANLPILISGSSGSISTPTWTAASVSNFVPPTAGAIDALLFMKQGASPNTAMAAPNSSYGAAGSTSNPSPMMVDGDGVTSTYVAMKSSLILESSNVYYAADNANSGLACVGWEDNI